MSATKIVVIVLVLIAVLFVAFVVWGLAKPGPKMTAKDFNKQKPPSLVSWFHQVLGSGGPKLDAAHMYPSLTTFDLQKQAAYTIKVLSDDDHPVRQARFKVFPPGNACAHMIFKPINAPQGLDKAQDTDDPDAGIKNRNDVTFSIPKGGGTLTIGREVPLSAPPCTVALQ
jgi:hypothetical protein